MARQAKSESRLTEAADKTAALLQGLQSRLNREEGSREETPEDLDQQLREYFVGESGKSSDNGMMDGIRDRVINLVADRILERWDRGDRRAFEAFEKQVIDRMAERILERVSRR
ncbi:MAG: hypothetical protein JWO19_246 [Bryobacterales bacterium]|nr:hypothetical protein [Bryobacterales bacterium]